MGFPAKKILSGVRNFLADIDDAIVRSFVSAMEWEMPVRNLAPRPLRCLVHLERIAEISAGNGRDLAESLRDEARNLHWGQTYTASDFGPRFIDNYGWLEVFGTRGHFVNDTIAGGFLILGPDIEYPDHHHVAEEVYIPLTGGTDWRMDGGRWGMRAAGEIIHHASNVSHAMRTGDEPLLAFYLWRGGPLAARSTITGVVEKPEA